MVADTMRTSDRFKEAEAWLRAAETRIPGNLIVRIAKANLTLTTTGNAEPLVAAYRQAVSLENPDPTERLDHFFIEINFADPQRALDYLDRWAPGTVDVQYQFWPEDLLRAFVLRGLGRAAEAQSLAARALPVIETAQRFEPNSRIPSKARMMLVFAP